MVRPELHRTARTADALSHPPQRPRLDAIAWKAGKKSREAEAVDQVAALLRTLEKPPRALESAEAN